VLDPVDSNLNVLSSFVVETADAMRVELYRVFQVARHTARIVPLSGEASDEGGAAPAVSDASHVPSFSSDVVTVDVVTAAVVAPVSPSKAQTVGVLAAPSKLASNQLPPNVMAELQDATGLHLGAAVATIKRNARGVVTGFRESKTAKAGDSLMRRYEVQVRLDMDGSSVYLYPDQLNVLSPQLQLKQNLPQPQVAVQQQRLPPSAAKEARTLDSSVVNAAVRNIARAVGRACAEGGSCTLMQLHKANPAYRGAAFSHDDDSRLALDALELLLRAHEHVFTLRPAFDKGDFQVQLAVPAAQAARTNAGSAVPVLNPLAESWDKMLVPAAPNFSVGRLPVALGNPQLQHQVLPPSSRAHMWHEMSGKVVQQQQERWN